MGARTASVDQVSGLIRSLPHDARLWPPEERNQIIYLEINILLVRIRN
jgi:hypothetical protein